MTPTEQLKKEHEAIKVMLRIMDVVCRRIEASRDVDPVHLEKMVEFIKVFADKCHHGKEEDLLFRAMEEAGFPREAGPIGVMLAEHDLGRGFVRGMSEALPGCKAKDRVSLSKFARNARSYAALLRDHINKEDNILYPMADARLTKAKQAELLEQFEVVENERIGPGKHEEFHRLLEQLEETYPQ